MAISNATKLAGYVGAAITGDGATGIITAQKFVGDGSQLTGVSGFATALSSNQASPLNKIFKTPKQLDVTAATVTTVESDSEASGSMAFIRESVVHVGTGATFKIASGTTLATNVLGIFP